jgi:hypothetical protein
VGKLWPRGDPGALCQALVSIANSSSFVQRAAVRTHFERELSSDALGAKLKAMYEDVLARRRGTAAAAASGIAVAS